MEDNLKLSKLEYHSNHLSDLPKILKLNWEDQTKIENCLKYRQSPMESENLRNHWLELPQILDFKWRRHLIKDLQIFKEEYLSNLLLALKQI
jgi:hypothetical protein